MGLFKDSIRQDDNLSLPLEIEGGHWEGTFRRFLWGLSLFVILLVIIGFFAPVREVALAEGEIIPVDSIAEVEHLEGGIVDQVLISEGDLVERGQPLIKLRSESGSGDFHQFRVRLDTLEMRRLRLVALLQKIDLDFAELGKRYPDDARDQQLLFESERAAVAAAGRILKARVGQRKSDLEARIREKEATGARIEVHEEQLKAQRKLLQKGFSSRANLLSVKAQLEEVKAQEAQLGGAVENARSLIYEVENELVQAVNAKQQEWSDLLLTTLGEIAELKERLISSEDRVKRLTIHAPRAGRVQSLAAKREGEVIRPGDLLAEIVPINARVEAEVRILPKDIGHINVGHPAEITLSTFDPEVFGKVFGELRSISPTTFETDAGEKYYRGLIELDRNILTHHDKEFPISTGMVITASVRTGSKSVMQYILKPIFRSYDRAFSER